MDVADDFPGSTVIGIDLSPIQPTLVPPNLEFIVQDLEEPWEMPNKFDFVHNRCMNGFSVKKLADILRERLLISESRRLDECLDVRVDSK
jgi:hypothetical protein